MKAAGGRRERRSLFVIAHRGFSGAAPENTLAAFQAAITLGCDMVELDVHLSQDGEIVVIHDDTLERTTDGRGRVAETPFSELRRLDAGRWFAPQFAGERIPSLNVVLALARGSILVNIEMKEEKRPIYSLTELADRTLEAVQKAGMEKQVLISSFSRTAIDRIRERNPTLPVSLITTALWTSPAEVGQGKCYPTLTCHAAALTESAIRLAHTEGIRINVWTVNTLRRMKQFIAWDIDGIITNHPDRLLKLLPP